MKIAGKPGVNLRRWDPIIRVLTNYTERNRDALFWITHHDNGTRIYLMAGNAAQCRIDLHFHDGVRYVNHGAINDIANFLNQIRAPASLFRRFNRAIARGN